ncbi:hypothetical protein MMC11_008295 [Xylographa trunciseda]|nr:hypothetical protein [Xylographa trunciseda]
MLRIRSVTSEPSSTEKIFLGEGFASWVAYYLAISGHGHYGGASSRAKALANFHGLSIDDRRAAAKTVAKTNPHPSFQDALDKMLRRPDIRRIIAYQIGFCKSGGHNIKSTSFSKQSEPISKRSYFAKQFELISKPL